MTVLYKTFKRKKFALKSNLRQIQIIKIKLCLVLVPLDFGEISGLKLNLEKNEGYVARKICNE